MNYQPRSEPHRRPQLHRCGANSPDADAPDARDYASCCGGCREPVATDASAAAHAEFDADSTLALAGLQRKVRALASPRGIALFAFGLFAALLLWRDDSAHTSALPYVVFLAFPALHLFLLRGEARGDAYAQEREQRSH